MINNFDFTVIKDFPGKQRVNEIPMKVLKVKKFDHFEEVQQRIAAFFGVNSKAEYSDLKSACFHDQMIQTIFEYFCLEFKAAPLVFAKFMEE